MQETCRRLFVHLLATFYCVLVLYFFSDCGLRYVYFFCGWLHNSKGVQRTDLLLFMTQFTVYKKEVI